METWHPKINHAATQLRGNGECLNAVPVWMLLVVGVDRLATTISTGPIFVFDLLICVAYFILMYTSESSLAERSISEENEIVIVDVNPAHQHPHPHPLNINSYHDHDDVVIVSSAASTSLNVRFSASPNVLFTGGLHLIYSYLQYRSWLTASHTCRQWYHAATSTSCRLPLVTHIISVSSFTSSAVSTSWSAIYRTLANPPMLPSPLLKLALCSRWYRRHVSSIIFESSQRSSCRNEFHDIFSDCFPGKLNSFDLQQLGDLFPQLTELKGFSFATSKSAITKGLIFEKSMIKAVSQNSKGGKGKQHHKSMKQKQSAVAIPRTMLFAPLASVHMSSLWMSLVGVDLIKPKTAECILESLSTHCSSLLSLVLSDLSMTVSFTSFASLPHLTRLSLPDYMRQCITHVWTWQNGYGEAINLNQLHFVARIQELSALPHLSVLSFNNFLSSALNHERRFLEILNQRTIMFPHLNELHLDKMKCRDRPLARFWYPRLTWQEGSDDEETPPLPPPAATVLSVSCSSSNALSVLANQAQEQKGGQQHQEQQSEQQKS